MHTLKKQLPLILISLLIFTGCDTAYYGAWEKVGVYKRDILVDRVEDAMASQGEAKEEFSSALDKFSSVVSVPASELKDTYEALNDSFEDAEEKAADVSERIDAVEDVSGDLFKEWENELEQIGNANLKSSSEKQLRASQRQYAELIKSMRAAEAKMPPVLDAFRDNVLFLKHNLNAQAISSLKTELSSIEGNVASLIREMESSIAASQEFIDDLELVGG